MNLPLEKLIFEICVNIDGILQIVTINTPSVMSYPVLISSVSTLLTYLSVFLTFNLYFNWRGIKYEGSYICCISIFWTAAITFIGTYYDNIGEVLLRGIAESCVVVFTCVYIYYFTTVYPKNLERALSIMLICLIVMFGLMDISTIAYSVGLACVLFIVLIHVSAMVEAKPPIVRLGCCCRF